MEKTVINIKTDKKLKEEAQKVAKEMGLPLGTIVNAYLRKLVRERQVVFRAPLVPNKRTAAFLKSAERDMKVGKNIDGPFTPEEAIEYLNSL